MIKNKKDQNIIIGLTFLKNTDTTAKAWLGQDGILRDRLIKLFAQGVHVHVLSKEEPELGDWVYDNEFFLNSKMEEDRDSCMAYKTDLEYYRIGKDARKIIQTTDPKILYYFDTFTKDRFPNEATELSDEELKTIIKQFNQ